MKPYAVSICCHLMDNHAVHWAKIVNSKTAKQVAEFVSNNIDGFIHDGYRLDSHTISINVCDEANQDVYSEFFTVDIIILYELKRNYNE